MKKESHYEWLVRTLSTYYLDECLIWPFRVDKDGYGRVHYIDKNVGAHRLSFKIANGHWPEPAGLHKCDVPSCVNPKHIWEGTDSDNHADQVAKGRTTKGTMQTQAKLTEKNVALAREEYRTSSLGVASLARKYGVTPPAMKNALKGIKNWKHVDNPVLEMKEGGRSKSEECKNGHPLTDDNCYIYGKTRQCKICTKIRGKIRDANARAKNTDARTRTEKSSDAAKSYWNKISSKDRSIVMKQRAKVRMQVKESGKS